MIYAIYLILTISIYTESFIFFTYNKVEVLFHDFGPALDEKIWGYY